MEQQLADTTQGPQALDTTEKPKRGRPPGKQDKTTNEVFVAAIAELQQEVLNMQMCIGKMAHYVGGSSPKICQEFGIKVYDPTKKDMRKYSS